MKLILPKILVQFVIQHMYINCLGVLKKIYPQLSTKIKVIKKIFILKKLIGESYFMNVTEMFNYQLALQKLTYLLIKISIRHSQNFNF